MDCKQIIQEVQIVEVDGELTTESFDETYKNRIPVILRNVDIGKCTELWTVDYLQKIGGERSVKVHVSPTSQMDFINKNFAYRSLPFGDFVKRAAEDKHKDYFFKEEEKYYLRSLGDNPRDDVADIHKQFPELAQDIRFPAVFDPGDFFSSVFRIASAGMQLWTHYDVMDNMLIQVRGKKRAVLFSPRDALNMYLNGDKSEVLDIDNPDMSRFPDFIKATRYECVLMPGDILFIPALWFHNVISLEFGIAVNVFWRHLESRCYDNKDTYGNKDPTAALRAIQIVDRALKTLDELPEEYKDFYARRMVARIQKKAFTSTNS